MTIGTVKWFNSQKGYRFIQPEDGTKPEDGTLEVCVHIPAADLRQA